MELALGIFGSLLISVLANELYDCAPTFACKIIRVAARRLPTNLRERYEEEWLAHLDESDGKLSKLCHSLECLLCARWLSKVSRHLPGLGSDVSLDLNTAKFFFASGAQRLKGGAGDQFLKIWTQLSGEDSLPSEDELRRLRKSVDVAQLRRLCESIGVCLHEKTNSEDVSFSFKITMRKSSQKSCQWRRD